MLRESRRVSVAFARKSSRRKERKRDQTWLVPCQVGESWYGRPLCIGAVVPNHWQVQRSPATTHWPALGTRTSTSESILSKTVEDACVTRHGSSVVGRDVKPIRGYGLPLGVTL